MNNYLYTKARDMSENTIVKKQVEAIEKSTKQAVQSKDSALRFLRDAGIHSTPLPSKAGHGRRSTKK